MNAVQLSPSAIASTRDLPLAGAEGRPRYCPLEMLATFTLLMAGHGRCVLTGMMLGNRPYAMEQLALAQTLHDPELEQVARRLVDYFASSRPHDGVAPLGAEVAGLAAG